MYATKVLKACLGGSGRLHSYAFSQCSKSDGVITRDVFLTF